MKGSRKGRASPSGFHVRPWSVKHLTDILSRLPVKDLIRFKCVCKRWQDLIESSKFITSHHNKMSTKRKSLILSNLHRPVVSTFSSENLKVSRYVDFPFFQDKKSPCELQCFYGPCKGVWCLYDKESSQGRILSKDYDEYISIGNSIALWNPATRELKALPGSCIRCPCLPYMPPYFWLQVNVGFGYDENTNDYKVVRISEFHNFSSGQRYPRVEMYSLNNDQWREIEATVPISIRNALDSSSASFNGIHYWLSENAILSFNISDEVFETIEPPMPQENPETVRTRKLDKLLVLHDSLALIVLIGSQYDAQEERFEVWKLKENKDVMEPWTKVSTIRANSNFRPWDLLGFWEDGSAVMMDFNLGLVLYDLETHGTKCIRDYDFIPGVEVKAPYFLIHFYAESLVSVKGGGRLTTPSSFCKLACYDDILPLVDYV